MTTRSKLGTVAVVLVAVCAVACGTNGDNAKSPTSVTTASVDPARVSPADLVTGPELVDSEGAIRDVTFGRCGVGRGKQRVEATIRNSASEARDYVVTVSWVSKTSDVLARGIATEKRVKPRAPVTVAVDVDVPKGVTQCTFHVDAGTL
jgi:hypothetical protein